MLNFPHLCFNTEMEHHQLELPESGSATPITGLQLRASVIDQEKSHYVNFIASKESEVYHFAKPYAKDTRCRFGLYMELASNKTFVRYNGKSRQKRTRSHQYRLLCSGFSRLASRLQIRTLLDHEDRGDGDWCWAFVCVCTGQGRGRDHPRSIHFFAFGDFSNLPRPTTDLAIMPFS